MPKEEQQDTFAEKQEANTTESNNYGDARVDDVSRQRMVNMNKAKQEY